MSAKRSSRSVASKSLSSTLRRHNIFEQLEGRQMFAAGAGVVDGVLTVTGTGEADRILVEPMTRTLTQTRPSLNGLTTITTTQHGLHVVVTDSNGVVRRNASNQLVDHFFQNVGINSVRVDALGGNDSVDVRNTTRNTTLNLGAGNDTARPGKADDVVNGGDGNDNILASAGKDKLFGQKGIDILNGLAGEDELRGGQSNDTLNVTFNLASFVNGRGKSIVPAAEFATTANGTDTLNLKVDLGKFVNEAVLPVIAKIQKVTGGLQPIIDLYNSEVPGIRDMVTSLNAQSLPGMSQLLSGLKLSNLLDQGGGFTALVNVINDVNHLNISTQNGTSMVNLGNYSIASENAKAKVTRVDTFNPLLSIAPITNALNSAGVQVPVLNNAAAWGQVVMGEDVTIFTLDLPKVDKKFDSPAIKTTIPAGTPTPFGPLPIPLDLGVNFDVKVKFGGKIGMDISGVRSGNYINGFFATPDTGGSYTFDVNPSIGTSVAGFGVSLQGTIGGTLKMTLADPNGDGKVRLSEMGSASNPFKLSPEIPYSLAVALTTPVGNFGTWTLVSDSIEL